MNVYIWQPVVVSDMQWPAPEGFHVPLNSEWSDVKTVWTTLGGWNKDWDNFWLALKLPYTWHRDYENTNVTARGTQSSYLSSDCNGSYNKTLFIVSYNIALSTTYPWYAGSIRPFKNESVIPTNNWTKLYWTSIESWWIFWSSTDWLISLSSDGSTWITIADKNLWATTAWNYWDTLSESNCWKYYQFWNNNWFAFTWSLTTSSSTVNITWYWPWNYYSSSTFITGNSWIPYTWTYSNLRWWVSQWSWTKSTELKNAYIGEYKWYTPWIYHNSTDWLISFSSDGTTWYTIADKNLWANTVYNNWDTLSASNCWYYYQWWNNYWFPWTWSISTSSTQVNASNYGPTNPYSSSTFIYGNNINWDSSNNMNLWWDITDTLEARKGPCDTWFHVPTDSDLTILCDKLTTISWEQIGDALKKYALMPMNWCRNWNSSSWDISDRNVFGWYWTSSTENFSYWSYPYRMYFYSSGKSISDNPTNAGFNVRPFKNEPVIPNSSWTKLK